MDADDGNTGFPQPSIQRAFQQKAAAVGVQRDPQKADPQGKGLHLLFFGAGSRFMCGGCF